MGDHLDRSLGCRGDAGGAAGGDYLDVLEADGVAGADGSPGTVSPDYSTINEPVEDATWLRLVARWFGDCRPMDFPGSLGICQHVIKKPVPGAAFSDMGGRTR